MWSFIHKVGSPKIAYSWAKKCQPVVAIACCILLIYGLLSGLAVAPADYQQGNVYRIIYLHVPAAIWSLGVYIVMSGAVIVHFIWKIKVADIIAKVSAPIGASLTLLTLITGAIWGEPTWGTWWVWDARLTSELILLFIYLGIIGIRSAIPERDLSARASGIVTIIGLVDIPIVHFSVDWWHTLHQGASLNLLSKPTIASSMLYPLLAMIIAFFLLYIWIVLIRLQLEILRQEKKTLWVREELQRDHQ